MAVMPSVIFCCLLLQTAADCRDYQSYRCNGRKKRLRCRALSLHNIPSSVIVSLSVKGFVFFRGWWVCIPTLAKVHTAGLCAAPPPCQVTVRHKPLLANARDASKDGAVVLVTVLHRGFLGTPAC